MPETGNVLRYMGCDPDRASPADRALAQEGLRQVMQVIHPRWNWTIFGISFEEGGVRLDCGLLLPGQDLKTHLTGCTRAVLYCATLGAEVDALIRRTEERDIALAFAIDCAAAEGVEALCDGIEEQLWMKLPSSYFPYRFSPGYGDLPLSLQDDLLTMLDAPRRVGLCASARHILTPRKSVTAVLGVSPHKIERKHRSCLTCSARDGCLYRKAGGHCGAS